MSFLDRIRSLLRGDRPAPDRSHTPDPSPATGPDADVPSVQVTDSSKGHNPLLHTAEVVVGGQHHSWTSGDRTALRPLLLRAAETPETALVDVSDHGAKSSNLFDVAALPRAHAPAFARLLEQFIAPTIRWRDEWVTAVRSSEDASHRAALIESDLPDDLRTAGLPAPEEVPRWTPEDPPTKLDALMATQERIDADWAEAIGAQQRTEDLSLDDRIDALGDLLAPADREQVAVGDTLAWPLTEQAESFRKLVAGG